MPDLLLSLFKDILFSQVEKGYITVKESKKNKEFLRELDNWANEYLKKNEHTIVSGSDFFNYVKNYNLFQNIISFIRNPQNQKENSFIESCCKNAIKYLNERKPLGNDDINAVKEFIKGIFEKTYAYYQNQVPDKNSILYYGIIQANAKLDAIERNIVQVNTVSPQKLPIIKKIYSMPENTIMRKVTPYKTIQESYFFENNSEDLFDACIREKHVVLLGEAGCGKSIVLNQLSSQVCDTSYFPLRYNLNIYTDSTIESIIFSEYPEIDLNTVFLIFDAYDEIEETNRNWFARKLCEFTSKNPNTIVLISSRNNFYTFSDDGNGGLFENFKEYGIVPLKHNDIKEYIKSNGINYDSFWKEVYTNELYNLIYSPFYLCELIKIYKKEKQLPQKSKIMEEIICNRFDKNCKKYIKTKDLENYEEEIFKCLEKLAFSIQCLKVTNISNRDYQRLFEDEHQRNLISYSGVFSKDSNKKWSFEHNNFREYLTAKYINKLSISELQKLIFDKNGKIINSWVNVLSFLVLIREDDDLLNLLMTNDPEMIVRFESSRLDKQTRDKITIKILEDFSKKSIWLSHGLNSCNAIAKFGQSENVCKYLLKQIENPINFKTQSNALSVLSEFSNLFGMEREIRNKLFECFKSQETREYEKCKALETIATLKLATPEIAYYITENFNNALSAYYRLGVYKYLNISNIFEDYIDFYIDEYESNKRYSGEIIGISYEINNAFENCQKFDSLNKIIRVIAKNRDTYSRDENLYKSIISNAIKLYQKGEHEIFNSVVESLIDSDTYNMLFFKNCIHFFDVTNTRIDAFNSLLEMDLHVKSYNFILTMESLGNDDCYMFLLSEYNKNSEKYAEAIKAFTFRFREDDPWLKKYREALVANGITPPIRKIYFDFQNETQAGQQYYFESLFDKEKYCVLVEKLVSEVGNKDITYSELKDIDYNPINYDNSENKKEEFALLHLYNRLTMCKNTNDIVFDTIRGIPNWNDFVILESYCLLDRNNEIHVNDEQKSFFKNYCDKQIKTIDFQNEFSCDKNSTTCSWSLLKLVFFSEYFNFEYDKNVYNEMLMLPSCLFNGPRYGEIPSYLADKYSSFELKEQIRKNLEIDTLCEEVLIMYIGYCKDNSLDFAVSAAEKICLSSLSSYHKHIAVEYLNLIKNYNYIYEKFLDTEDKELLDVIIEITINYKDERLKDRLEEISKKSSEENLYISNLIFLNSRYALEQYMKICKKAMKSNTIPHNSHIDSVFDAISAVSDINLIDIIGELQILLFTDGFEDIEDFGLWNCLYNAYRGLAINNYESVKEHIENVLKDTSIRDREKSFCNMLLVDINNFNNQRNDIAWSIEEIKQFLSINE